MPRPLTMWSPAFAPHVEGQYEERTFEGGLPQEQRWYVRCTTCGATYQGRCASGSVRQRIKRFATVHLHRDPFAPKKT